MRPDAVAREVRGYTGAGGCAGGTDRSVRLPTRVTHLRAGREGEGGRCFARQEVADHNADVAAVWRRDGSRN